MRRWIGSSLVALGAIGTAFGLWNVLAAGGYEADAVRVGGFFYLALGVIIAAVGWVIIRSQR